MIFEEEIRIVIQPIFSTQTKEVTYGELLTRPLNGEAPNVWIDRLSDSGKLEFDLHMIHAALEFIREFKGKVSVNVTKESIGKVEAVDKIKSMLEYYGEEKESLVIELSEYTEYNNEVVISNIQRIRSLGIKIAMDDYGIANAQLCNLFKVSIDAVKFDKMYVNKYNKTLAEMIQLMHQCDKDTILECVETQEQYTNALQLGYKNVQGVLFSAPICRERFLEKYGK